MTILFVHTDTPSQTLEDETFLALTTIYPKALTFKWRENTAQDFRSFLIQHRPSLIISRQMLPRAIFIPNLIISSAVSSKSLSWFLRTNVFVLSHSPQKTKHPQYLLPPLLKNRVFPAKPSSHFLSVGPLNTSSQHHVALDAYSMLPERVRKNYSLIFCGHKESQETIDRLKLHGYGLSISFIHDFVQTRDMLSHAKIVFRLGNASQKNLAIDHAILEHQHAAIHLKDTPRTYLYPSNTCAHALDPHHIKTLVQGMMKRDSKDLGLPFNAQSTHSKYTYLIDNLQKR